MHVIVEIVTDSIERPAAGAPIRVEARDTTLQDVAAETLGVAEGVVRGVAGTWLDTVELTFDRRAGDTTIWAHVDADRDGRVSRGDYVTTASYPIPATDGGRITVAVRRV